MVLFDFWQMHSNQYFITIPKNGQYANKQKRRTFINSSLRNMTYKHLLFFLLLVVLSSQALNEQADADIRRAIKLAVLDGLKTVDQYLRQQYWYYIQGTQRISFNVVVLRDHLNYIILYQIRTTIFRFNVNLDKITWKPSINSIVRREGTQSVEDLRKPNISLLSSKDKIIDFTNKIQVTADQVKGDGDRPQKQKEQQPFNNDGPQVLTQNAAPQNGIIVLNSPPTAPTRPKQPQSLTSEPAP